MYRKGTLILTMALAFTLMAATVATGAPKEKRVVCQDGVTKEIPAHAKAKGATEGPCESPVNPIAEAACRDVYKGTFIPPDTCEYTDGGNSSTLLEDGRVLLEFNGTWRYTWDENGFITSTLLSYEPVRCIDRWYDTNLDVNSLRCQIPTGLIGDV